MSGQNPSGSGSTTSQGSTGAPPSGVSLSDSTPTRKRGRQYSAGAAIGIAVLMLVVGIGGGYALGAYLTKVSTATVDITETGSTLLEPLIDIWGPNYTADVNSHVLISPSGGGSGQGRSEAEAGTIDIGASDAYVLPGLGVADIPVATSSQLVMYNLGTSFAKVHLNLNGSILAQIYDGTITKWNNWEIAEANPGVSLPSATITPVVRSDSSGDTYIFSVYCDLSYHGWLYGNSTSAFATTAPASGYASGDGNAGMVSELTKVADSIGYVGISYMATAVGDGLGYAALGDNLANSAAGGNVTATPSDAKNYINWSAQNVSEDANLGLLQLNYATDGLAVSLILGGSPAGAVTWSTGGGGSNPTVAYPDPYPIVNLENTLLKLSPASPSHEAYVVQFEQWAISYGQSSTYLNQVGFVALTPELQGLDEQALATVTISS